MKPVNELTPQELRLEVAQWRGFEARLETTGTQITWYCLYQNGKRCSCNAYADRDVCMNSDTPDYTGDFTAAGELLTETMGTQYLWDVYQLHNNALASSWCADIDEVCEIGGLRLIARGFDKDMLIAICRAYITWRRQEREQCE